MLHRFLSLYGEKHITKAFVPDQTMNAVFLAEAFEGAILVLPSSTDDVGCHADVERAVEF